MNQYVQSNEYEILIKKIRRKKKIVRISTIIALLITLAFCLPIYIYILGKTYIDYSGVHPIITVFLVLFILFCALIAYAFVMAPVTGALDIECDPQKHFILSTEFLNPKQLDSIYAADYIYMGNFIVALNYANKMIANNKSSVRIIGLFNKARCEFFLDDFESLKLTVKQYETALSDLKKVNKKTKLLYEKIQKAMNLSVAIADKDIEKIHIYRDVEVWNNSKATQGYINYLKGLAAYITQDKEEAIYRFMAVKEQCEKTIFSKMAEQYLSDLK